MVKLDKRNREQYIKAVLEELQAERKESFRDKFLSLHPSDQADIFTTLDNTFRIRVYNYLTAEEFAAIFGSLDIKAQELFFPELNEHYASSMFNNMFTDDVVNFLTDIDMNLAEKILRGMDEKKAGKVQAILAYAHETAGAIMTKELISISSAQTVANVLDKLRDEAPDAEIIYYLYVVDADSVLVGVVSLRDLIIAQPDVFIEEVMRSRPVSVSENMDQEEVGKMIKKYDFLAVPVTSQDGRLLGIVTVDDVMDILEEETTEDFGEISATKGATDINLSAFTAARKRSPWIIALMFFGLITGGVIGRFEDTLESVVLLAAFIPMIMDSGGNVGTQSLAVSVRGLALGTIETGSFLRMVRREFTTGALIGLICMVLIAALVTVFYGHWMLGIIVGVSILCTLSISAVVGSVIPLIINKLRFDPAIASGPFITTVNDIIGLLIYFYIATYLIEFL
jgi:magnesium transporter